MGGMRNFFVYDGVNVCDFGAWVLNSNAFNAAERDIQRVTVVGRSGDLTISNNRFKNLNVDVVIGIPFEKTLYTHALRAHLLSDAGYRRYEETFHPDEYRMARYTGGFDVSRHSDRIAVMTLHFDCMPQRFLKSGEMPIAFSQDGILYNETMFASKPLIRVYGQGIIVIGGCLVEILEAPDAGFTDIDCETLDARCGTENRNAYVSFESGKVELGAGENYISLTDVTSIEITPRWWTV